MLDLDGEHWRHLPVGPTGLGQKTFWWSSSYASVNGAPLPPITVQGHRLGGTGTFTAGNPGTNAIADFGLAMLVGVEIPAAGCWEIRATYRGAGLAYVAWVGE